MTAVLYGFAFSHPVQAVMAMLRHKGVEHRLVAIPPGLHPLVVRGRGFPGSTVPALRLAGGERVQGSTAISRRLDALVADPPLFPADPERRRAVEEAEAWGESVLQAVPRVCFRWALAGSRDLRARLAGVAGLPLPAVVGALSWPQAQAYARASGATADRVRAHVAALPGHLDHADALIAAGTIGGPRPTAADFQIGATVRALTQFEDFAPLVEGRPCAALTGLFPPVRERMPAFVPAGWR